MGTRVIAQLTVSAMALEESSQPLCENEYLRKWVEETADLTKPAAIHWVDGSQEEYDLLCAQMVATGALIKLNQDLLPGCYYARSDPDDVARVEDRTFICSASREGAGPPITGTTRSRCAARSGRCFPVVCAAGPCTFCPSAWARWARRCRRSGCNSPIRPTSW